jgi:hypothetical protein
MNTPNLGSRAAREGHWSQRSHLGGGGESYRARGQVKDGGGGVEGDLARDREHVGVVLESPEEDVR